MTNDPPFRTGDVGSYPLCLSFQVVKLSCWNNKIGFRLSKLRLKFRQPSTSRMDLLQPSKPYWLARLVEQELNRLNSNILTFFSIQYLVEKTLVNHHSVMTQALRHDSGSQQYAPGEHANYEPASIIERRNRLPTTLGQNARKPRSHGSPVLPLQPSSDCSTWHGLEGLGCGQNSSFGHQYQAFHRFWASPATQKKAPGKPPICALHHSKSYPHIRS